MEFIKIICRNTINQDHLCLTERSINITSTDWRNKMIIWMLSCWIHELNLSNQQLLQGQGEFHPYADIDSNPMFYTWKWVTQISSYQLSYKPVINYYSLHLHLGILGNKYNENSTLTHCGLVTPYGGRDLGQHWFRKWLVAWRHQAITWIKVDLSSVRSSGIHLSAIISKVQRHSSECNFTRDTSAMSHWN